jgi:hypothetical protein
MTVPESIAKRNKPKVCGLIIFIIK